MPEFNRVDNTSLDVSRLDAEYYGNTYVANAELIENTGTSLTLEEMRERSTPIRRGIDMPHFVENEGSPKMVTIASFDEPGIQFDQLKRVSLEQHNAFKGSHIQPDDLLVAMGGYAGKAAICPQDTVNCNIGRHTARIKIDPTIADARYIWAFITCRIGTLQFERYVTGSVQAGINLEDIRNIKISVPCHETQKYIGDKVRQAELLRAWAKCLERSLDTFIDHFQPEKKEYKKLCSRVPNNLLTNMLTATTYRERYISNQKNLKSTSCTQSISYYLSSITNGYDERNEIENGLPYIKVANLRAGYIDLKNSPRVRLSALIDASAKQKPKKGDLLLTRKGSFGIAAVVMDSASFLCSSEVFSCKPSKPEFMPILSWFLNSEAGNMQFWQFSTGTTMPGINQENLQNILIPDFSACDIEQFNSIHENRYEAKKSADLLTDTAKTLVEALIEGQLTEQQLIQAQQALEDGDNSLDQAILSKLSAEGYAIEGATPLFSDMDELYRLLASAAQAETEE